jgi:hypothetical protein
LRLSLALERSTATHRIDRGSLGAHWLRSVLKFVWRGVVFEHARRQLNPIAARQSRERVLQKTRNISCDRASAHAERLNDRNRASKARLKKNFLLG